MEAIDQADEYRKLQELYAAMTISQLQDLAAKVGDLTDIAQQVLRDEISKRGLDKQAPEVPGEDSVPSEDDLVAIRSVKDSTEAQEVMGVLESEGILSVPGTEKYELVGGGSEDQMVIKVVTSDRTHALTLLNQYFPPKPEPEEDVDHVPVSPSCHSPDIVFQSLDASPAAGTPAKFNWSCDACGHQWRDDGLEQEV